MNKQFKNPYTGIQQNTVTYSRKSHTIEGQALSVREILSRFTRGENLSLIEGSPTFTERLNLDVRRLSKIELDEYYKDVINDVADMKGNLTKAQKEKAIADAQQRFNEAVEQKAKQLSEQKAPTTPDE